MWSELLSLPTVRWKMAFSLFLYFLKFKNFEFFLNSVLDSERIFLDIEFWFFLSPIEVFTIDCLESVEICYGLVISDFIVFRIIEVPYSDRVRKGLRVIDLRFRLTSNRMKTQQLCCIFCTGRCAVKWLQRLEIDMRIKWIGHGTTCRLHPCLSFFGIGFTS